MAIRRRAPRRRICASWWRATSRRHRAKWWPKSAFCPSSAGSAAPCDEHAGPTHVTASGIVVGRRGTVLHRHKKLGIWMQPGGHIDAGERPEEAALREATEELGLAVDASAGRSVAAPPRCPRGGARAHAPRPALPVARRGRGSRSPRRTRAPMRVGASWDEALGMADPALIDALPLARAAYEAMA